MTELNVFLKKFDLPLEYSYQVVGPNTRTIYLKKLDYFKMSKLTSLVKELEEFFNRNIIINTRELSLTLNLQDEERTYLTREDTTKEAELDIDLGRDKNYQNIVLKLSKAPHLLIAGTTGSGKSVVLRNIMNQLDNYEFIDGKTHTLEEVNDVLDKYLDIMARRYEVLASYDDRHGLIRGTCDIDMFNKNLKNKLKKYVLIIDEYADLSMQDIALKTKKYGIESKVVRLCQKARAAGIHVILATQRPDARTISGLIRANMPSRIALKTGTAMESKIILDVTGAEKLNPRGDMLFKFPGEEMVRCQGYQA